MIDDAASQPDPGVETDPVYPCPCCGFLVHDEGPGSFLICPICFWEDDLVQLRWPWWSGGANKPSLIEAQHTFQAIGAESPASRRHARPPGHSDIRDPGFRPVSPEIDRYERPEAPSRPYPQDLTTLYWWRPDYWNPADNPTSQL